MKVFEPSVMDEKSTEYTFEKIVRCILKGLDTSKGVDRTNSYDLSTVSTARKNNNKARKNCKC